MGQMLERRFMQAWRQLASGRVQTGAAEASERGRAS
jgi:hypothetical protein